MERALQEPSSTSIDWSTVDREIVCPLCGYNLRGLERARCPECGHAFDWDELLSGPTTLPWLYEHGRGIAARRLVETLVRSLAPRRFWASVRPIHAVRPIRLIIYALVLLSVSAVASWLPLVATAYAREAGRMPAVRAQLHATLVDDAGNLRPGVRQALSDSGHGTVEAYLDAILPSPALSALWYAAQTWRPMQRLALPVIGWPVLTVALLVAFRKAFRQKDAKAEHLWRVAVYCGDVAFVGWALLLPAAHWLYPLAKWLGDRSDALYFMTGGYRAGGGGMLAGLGIALVSAYRFRMAYRRYLGWPNAGRTVLLIQLFVLLALFRGMMMVNSDV